MTDISSIDLASNPTLAAPKLSRHRRTLTWGALLLLTNCSGTNPDAAVPTAQDQTAQAQTAQAQTASNEAAAPGTATTDTINPAAPATDATAGAPSAPNASTSASPPAASAPPPKCPERTTYVAGGSYQRKGAKTEATIVDLCVDTLETTVDEYGECVRAGQCTTTGLDCSAQATWAKAGKEQQPIVCIDYDQASAYCAYRGKRLPTLEEWEWVARSGEEARTYPWGNEPPNDQLCWTGKRRQTESCVVGTHPADRTAAGALDMAGNVLEFVTTSRDPSSPVHIAKGGAWNGGDAALFTNGRLGGFRKEYRCGFLGVRCVAPQAEPAAR